MFHQKEEKDKKYAKRGKINATRSRLKCFFFINVCPSNRTSPPLSYHIKQIILTSQWHTQHQFAAQNSQPTVFH